MQSNDGAPRKMPAKLRRVAALELRLAGRPYREIADCLGYTSVSGAFAAVEKALHEHAAVPADDLLYLELARLDALLAAYWPRATADHDLQAATFVVNVIHRRAKLLGLEAPRRVDVSGLVASWAESQGLDAREVIQVAEEILRHGGLA